MLIQAVVQASGTSIYFVGPPGPACRVHFGQRSSAQVDGVPEHPPHQRRCAHHVSRTHAFGPAVKCYKAGADWISLQNGWRVDTLAGAWSMMLNLINLCDALLHAVYAALAARQLWQQANSLAALGMYHNQSL